MFGAACVAAAPIRWIVASSASDSVSSHIRVGLPAVPLAFSANEGLQVQPKYHAQPCKANRWRKQVAKFMNKIKTSLGSELTAGHSITEPHFPMIVEVFQNAREGDHNDGHSDSQKHHHYHHHHPSHRHGHHRLRHPGFGHRLVRALTELGKWEGRGVAFVIGCGLGVLLRMIWILLVLVTRYFRPIREDQARFEHAIYLTSEESDVSEKTDLGDKA